MWYDQIYRYNKLNRELSGYPRKAPLISNTIVSHLLKEHILISKMRSSNWWPFDLIQWFLSPIPSHVKRFTIGHTGNELWLAKALVTESHKLMTIPLMMAMVMERWSDIKTIKSIHTHTHFHTDRFLCNSENLSMVWGCLLTLETITHSK